MGYTSSLQGVRRILNHIKKIPHKGSKRVLGGMQRGSILIWGYAKGVKFGFWGTKRFFCFDTLFGYISNKRLRTLSLYANLSKLRMIGFIVCC